MVDILSDPAYFFPPLIGVAVSLSLLVVALLWSRRDLSTWLFCGLLINMVLVNSLLFGMRVSPDIYHALVWEKAMIVPMLAIFVFYYHFTLTITNNRGQRHILRVCYLFLVVVAILSPTDILVKEMRVDDYGYDPVIGVAAYPLLAVGYFLVFAGARNVFKSYKLSTSAEERKHLIYLLIAAVFPLIGAILDGYTNAPPSLIWCNLIFCILCSIAIVKYNLLDIRVFVRKSLVYLLVSAVVAIPYVGILLLVSRVLGPIADTWWVYASMLLLLAILLRPLYGWAQNIVDRMFFRDRYDYLRALDQFSRETQSVAKSKDLGSTLVKLVSGALKSSSACLLVPSRSRTGFAVSACVGLDNPPSGTVIMGGSLLAKWFERHGRILSSRELGIIPELQSLAHREKQNLEKLRGELYVPIKTHESGLSGVLVLGEKLGQQSYSSVDVQLLGTLANQMAMTLENAQLYDSERTMREELEKLDEQKTEFLHSVGHELRTPLTAIISSSELMSEGSSIARSLRERLINNIRESALSMDRRVAELLDLARMQIGELKIEIKPLEMGHVITEIASQLGILFENKEQTLTLEIPDLLLKVNGDRGKLEQVVFNLLSNANKFSPAGSNIVLRVRQTDRRTIVEVEDSAPAVSKEEKSKLFDPYYRSKDSDKRDQFSGLGLGLAISKRVVELHRGEIWVKSKSGKGNTFAFSLPVLDQRTNGIK